MNMLAWIGIIAQIVPIFFIIKIGISMMTHKDLKAAAEKHTKAAPVH